MSHFVTFVLIPATTPSDAYQATVAKLLAPFDESIEVNAYPTDCYCVGSLAQHAGFLAAEKEIGIFQELREQYWALPETERPEWSAYTAPFEAVANRVEQAHPLYQKPNSACEECKGTGIRQTTYNPNSQWDWWSIGGRWNEWMSPTNSVPATALLQDDNKIPFAMVTPDGQWHQRGHMGWWCMVSDKKADDMWAQEVRQLLQTYPDTIAVACDLHI